MKNVHLQPAWTAYMYHVKLQQLILWISIFYKSSTKHATAINNNNFA